MVSAGSPLSPTTGPSPARGAAPVWDEVVDLDDGESTGPDGDEEVRAQIARHARPA